MAALHNQPISGENPPGNPGVLGQHASNPSLGRKGFEITPWLQLIRWPNLLIIFFTQAAVWWCVIQPLSEQRLILNWTNFLFLSLSTVCIAAAGYIINDYFDIRIDAVNRPEKFILEKKIHRRIAIILHSVLNVVGLMMAAVVAQQTGSYLPVLLQISCTILLWLYSTHFKQRFAIGNFTVALLTALAVITLLLYEKGIHSLATASSIYEDATDTSPYFVNPVYMLAGYAYFAFVLTWMREVVKDMEDIKGDSAEGCDTMPIRWGLLRSSRFTQVLGLAAILPLAYGSIRLLVAGLRFLPLGLYLIAAVIIPLLVWTVQLTRKATTTHYAKASRWLKIIMVLGVGFLFLYRYAYA